LTDDNGHLPAQGRSQTFRNAEVTTNNRKRKSEPQTDAVQLASDDENRAAPTKKTKTTSNSNVPVKQPAPRPIPKKSTNSNVPAKQPAPRPIPKKSTSSKNTKDLVPSDRAVGKAGIPEGFVTPVHLSTKVKTTGNGGVTQPTLPESRPPGLRRTGIYILE